MFCPIHWFLENSMSSRLKRDTKETYATFKSLIYLFLIFGASTAMDIAKHFLK